MKTILLIPKISIHNANALSSPYTIGFPAMTAWLGWMHNIQRKLQAKFTTEQTNEKLQTIQFKGICISCHDIDLHTFQNNSKNASQNHIIGTANPLKFNSKKGQWERPPFIPEARVSLDVTIAIELNTKLIPDLQKKLFATLASLIYQNKIASGDVISFSDSEIKLFNIDEENSEDKEFKDLKRKLMPGYCLISRQELVTEKMQQGKSALQAILDYLTVTTELNKEKNKSTTYNTYKKEQEKGWIIPIPIGYQGLTEPQNAKITRDENTPHLFAESVLTLGEFIMPTQFNDITQLFWHYPEEINNDLYLCKNTFQF
jgi:CRISPR-associated protein Csy2